MTALHGCRSEPGFYNAFALGRARLDAPAPIGGLAGAVMSHDRRSGSVTYLVEIPSGWRGRTEARDGALELFLWRGAIEVNGEFVQSGGYLHLPQGCGGSELHSESGALAIAFWNPNAPCFAYPLTRNRVVNPIEEPWVDSIPGAHGIRHKSLRKPDPVPHPCDEGFDGGPGGYLRFQYIEPNTIARDEHVHHECFEEIILLAGDCLLVNEGQMGPGSVVNHPQEWYHAPFFSRTGALILVHTDAPMGFPWPPRDYPGADDLAHAYFADGDLSRPVEHVHWDEHPLRQRQEASAEYHQWRAQHAPWGDVDQGSRVPYMAGGRDTVSTFRAGWSRRP